MCRGCYITKNGKSTIDEYLDWLDDYLSIIHKMKLLEKRVLDYQSSVDFEEHKKVLDSFRRKLIKQRREYAKADDILNYIRKLK